MMMMMTMMLADDEGQVSHMSTSRKQANNGLHNRMLECSLRTKYNLAYGHRQLTGTGNSRASAATRKSHNGSKNRYRQIRTPQKDSNRPSTVMSTVMSTVVSTVISIVLSIVISIVMRKVMSSHSTAHAATAQPLHRSNNKKQSHQQPTSVDSFEPVQCTHKDRKHELGAQPRMCVGCVCVCV
jgi:hypothetical protein